jgi:hypothetical protein
VCILWLCGAVGASLIRRTRQQNLALRGETTAPHPSACEETTHADDENAADAHRLPPPHGMRCCRRRGRRLSPSPRCPGCASAAKHATPIPRGTEHKQSSLCFLFSFSLSFCLTREQLVEFRQAGNALKRLRGQQPRAQPPAAGCACESKAKDEPRGPARGPQVSTQVCCVRTMRMVVCVC